VRELILIGVVVALAGVALIRPQYGVFSYIWFALMRPDYFAWAAGNFPFSPLLAGATLVGACRNVVDVPILFKNLTSLTLLIYQIPIALSVLMAVIPELTYPYYFEFERIMLMVFLIPVLVKTEKDLRNLCLVIALSQGMIGLKFGLFGLRNGGVYLESGYAGLDNNAVALALVMVLPFCWYMRQKVDIKWLKAVLLVMSFTCITAVIMTKSRNGALAMGTVFLLITLRSKHKIPVLIMLALLSIPALYLFQNQFVARMSTLKDVSADKSASSRWVLSMAALHMWKDHPFFGVGFGNDVFMTLEAPYLQIDYGTELKVHDTYMQILVDSGPFALLIFVFLLGSTIVRLWLSSHFWKKRDPGLRIYPLVLQTSLIAIAQYGFAGGRERYDFLYIVLMSAAVWFNLDAQKRAEYQAAGLAPAAAALPQTAAPRYPAGSRFLPARAER
jgi:putative inorganic carbon (HCO3(-)) transporter